MLKRVHPGDQISLSSNAYNAWCDAADDLRQRQMATSASQRPETRDVDIVLVRNDSGSDVDQFGILGIGIGGGLKVATLDASLSHGGTCSATITKGGFGTVTAHDVLLQSGESLDAGTKVILTLIGGDECVIDASCST